MGNMNRHTRFLFFFLTFSLCGCSWLCSSYCSQHSPQQGPPDPLATYTKVSAIATGECNAGQLGMTQYKENFDFGANAHAQWANGVLSGGVSATADETKTALHVVQQLENYKTQFFLLTNEMTPTCITFHECYAYAAMRSSAVSPTDACAYENSAFQGTIASVNKMINDIDNTPASSPLPVLTASPSTATAPSASASAAAAASSPPHQGPAPAH
jgi:hypothetical protein